MFADVPTLPGYVGLFGLLEAATPGKRSKGASAWRNAADAGRALPPAPLAAFPSLPKKSRVVSGGCVMDALEGVLAASDYAALLSKEDAKASLLGLMLRAGMAREEAERQWAEAEARALEKSQAKVAMLTELGTLLGRNGDSLKLRCTRVEGGWIFARYDAIALMLDPVNKGQARMIWERMLEAIPDFGALQKRYCFQFGGAGQQQTPAADARGIALMLLLVPGLQAAAKRRPVASAFARCFGEDFDEIEKAAAKQQLSQLQLRRPYDSGGAGGDDLYIMRYSHDCRYVKIGRARDVEKRRRGLQSCQNFYVRTVAVHRGSGRWERFVHRKLQKHRSRLGAGAEWFRLAPAEAARRVGGLLWKRRWGARLWGLKSRRLRGADA